MFLKLGILGVLLILGGIVFSSEISGFFSNTSALVTESLKHDVNNISQKATESIENKIESSLDNVVDNTSEKINDRITDAKESSTNFLSDELGKINPFESIENVFKNTSLEEIPDNP